MTQITSQRAEINSKTNKIVKSVLILLVFFMLVLFVFSCDIFTPQPEAGSRNYVWELDTLDMPMNYINTVWGASPDDVWAMGEGGTEYDRLMHYDGNEWSTYTNEIIWCSGSKLFGFSEDDIWMGGGAGWLEHGAGIWHYDGNTWQQFYVYDTEEDNYCITIQDLWGSSPDDIYASGVISYYDGVTDCWRGFALHYDGEEWTELVRADFGSQFLAIRSDSDNKYIYSVTSEYNTNDERAEGFYRVSKDSSLSIIYNTTNDSGDIEIINMCDMDGEILFVIENDVFRYRRNKLVPFLHVDNEHFAYQVFGRSKNDLFISMDDGIAHYNGEDVEYLYHFPSDGMSVTREPCILENDIFYSIRNWGSSDFNLVLHGKLVEE